MNDRGHYFYYQVRAQYEGTGGQTSTNTTGLMRVSFDTFNYSDYSTSSTTKDFDLVYSAAAN